MAERRQDAGRVEAAARLSAAARVAREAEARGDDAAATEAWHRYRLIRDALRDPDERIAEGVALSSSAQALLGGS